MTPVQETRTYQGLDSSSSTQANPSSDSGRWGHTTMGQQPTLHIVHPQAQNEHISSSDFMKHVDKSTNRYALVLFLILLIGCSLFIFSLIWVIKN